MNANNTAKAHAATSLGNADFLNYTQKVREASRGQVSVLPGKADFDRMISFEVNNMLPAAEAHRRAEEFGEEIVARMRRDSEGEK
jgi:hypothetical protein